MEPTLQYSPSRTRSTRLGAGRVVRPLDSPLHPTIYPLASTKSSRRNNARFTSGEEASVSQEYNRVAKVASPAASGVYETPQFRTFQERKRDKEKQLAAAAGREWRDPEDSRPESFPARIAQTEEYPHGPRILAETPASSSTSSRSASPSWLGRDVGIVLPGVGIPLAPANIAPGSSTTSSKFATRRPLPVPFKQTNTILGVLSPSEKVPFEEPQPMTSRPLPANAYKTKEDPAGSQSGTPDPTAARALTAQNGLRRLPKPKTMSPIVAPFTQRGAHTLSSPTESAFATSPIDSTTDAILGGLDHGPIWKRDSFARSDTVTSVKSLDRFGLCQSTERPLPTPPVSVGTSRSLDRGPSTILPMQPLRNDHALTESTEQPRDPTQKSSDSTIQDHLDQNHDDGDVGSPPITVPTPVVKAPSRINSASHAVVQVDSPDRASSPMPSYAYSNIPIISVAMVPSHEFDATSSNVPSITLPGDDKASDPASPVGFPEMPIIVIPGDDQPHGRVDTAGTQAIQRSVPGIFCARCDNAIIGRIVSAMDKRWHPECFQCSSCRTLLEHVSSYEHDGKAYCHMDYHDVSSLRSVLFGSYR